MLRSRCSADRRCISVAARSVPDSADFNLADEDFTVECWIRPTTVTGIHDIIGQWEDLTADLGWILSQNGAGLQLNVSTTGLDDIVVLSASSVLTANAWHAIAVDFDGTKYRLYVNGVDGGLVHHAAHRLQFQLRPRHRRHGLVAVHGLDR